MTKRSANNGVKAWSRG